MYRYSGSFICKETISSVKHYKQVLYFLISQLSIKSLNNSLSFIALYNTNPIFITRHVSFHTHIFRTYPFHWNHNTCSFELVVCNIICLYHYNQRPTCQLLWSVQEISKGDHYRPRYKIWRKKWKTNTYLVTPDQRGFYQVFIKTGWSRECNIFLRIIL